MLEIGHRRRGARPLFDHRHEARPDLAVPRHHAPGSTARPASTAMRSSRRRARRSTGCATLIAESRIALPADLPAAAAGLFGYLGYDMIRLVEHLPDCPPDTLGLPDAVLMRPSVVAVLDGVKGEVTVVSPAFQASGLSARAAYAQAAERVMDAVRDLERAPSDTSRDLGEAMAGCRAGVELHPRRLPARRSRRPRTTSAPATSFRWCPRSAGRRTSPCRPSRSTARCAAPTRRRSCSSSTSAASRSSAPRPRSWCGCSAAR